jgi:hypothetical protein
VRRGVRSARRRARMCGQERGRGVTGGDRLHSSILSVCAPTPACVCWSLESRCRPWPRALATYTPRRLKRLA